MNITLRPVVQDDIPFLWEMLYESLFVPDGQEPFDRRILNRPSIANYLDGWGRDGDYGIIALNNRNQSIGSISYRFFDENNISYGYISPNIPELSMAVIKKCRGRGVGSKLLHSIIETARSKGLKALSLSVQKENPAYRLYQRFGFHETAQAGSSLIMRLDL